MFLDADMRNSDIIKIILAIFLPPVGVFLERGCGADLLINILLTILGYIPYVYRDRIAIDRDGMRADVFPRGIIHALYIILKY